ncbi:MAG TPA: protein disulfide oxidoreductase [Thiothrix sp.]|nr:protein disulfide oxidoreductase [Thiothrix sp.]
MENLEKEKSVKRKKNKVLGWFFDAFVVVAIFVAIQMWMQRDMAGGEAIDFKAMTTSGENIALSDYKGKPLLLHFWASWCHYCTFEQGSITDISKDTPVLTVAFQSGSTIEVAEFMEKKGISSWVTIVDEEGDISKNYGVSAVPATFIIDENGKIRFKTAGFTSEWGLKLRLWLTSLLY